MLLLGFRQTMKAEIPIRTYKVVQTGANKLLGGRQDGLWSEAYQSGIFAEVTDPATAPKASGKPTQTSKASTFAQSGFVCLVVILGLSGACASGVWDALMPF